MLWAAFALGQALFGAVWGEWNARFRLPGRQMVLWRGLVPMLILLPLLLLLPPPTNWHFYAAVILNAMIVRFTDARFFDAAARFGGAVPMRLAPLSLLFTFLGWLLYDHSQMRGFIEQPQWLAAMLVSLLIMVMALMRMARCEVSRAALVFMAPAIFAAVAIDLLNKYAMAQAGHVVAGALYYGAIMSGIIFVMALPAGLNKTMLQAQWRAGLGIGALTVGLTFCKNLAMYYTPNPAYVAAIGMSAPLWLMGWHKLKGRKDDADVVAGLLFVVGAITLVLVGAQVH